MLPAFSCRVPARFALAFFSVIVAPVIAQTISVTVTDPNQSQFLSAQPNISFGASPANGSYVVTVNDAQTYNVWDGIGAAWHDATAVTLAAVSPTVQANVLQQLFSPTNGIGLSFLRVPMGATDSSVTVYSYDDNNNVADPSLSHFSIQPDLTAKIPQIQAAETVNPALKVMLTPWSPPAWMKSNDSMVNGNLNTNYFSSLAQYFVDTIQAYQANGIPIYALTVQNEPEYCGAGYPAECLDANTETSFINSSLGPALASASLSNVKILGYDHDWDDTSYPEQVAGSSYVAGSAFHCYGGDPAAMAGVVSATNKDVWVTECTRQLSDGFANDLRMDAENLIIGSTRHGARSIIYWDAVLDQNFGPLSPAGLSAGLCSNVCLGLLTVDTSTGAVTPRPEYYSLGHIGKFVTPGALRVFSASQGDGGFNGSGVFMDVAFRNPDGTIALIAYNDTSSNQPIAINWNNAYANYTMTPGSYVTFKWQGSTALTGLHRLVNVNAHNCLADPASSPTAGTQMIQWSCNGFSDQTWNVTQNGDGTYKFQNQSSEMCLDYAYGSPENNTPVIQEPCDASNGNQNFTVVSSPSSGYQIKTSAGNCVDVFQESTQSGALVEEWQCSGRANEAFQFQ